MVQPQSKSSAYILKTCVQNIVAIEPRFYHDNPWMATQNCFQMVDFINHGKNPNLFNTIGVFWSIPNLLNSNILSQTTPQTQLIQSAKFLRYLA